jgi:RNA polymerase sigma-70 factor, ECF subfamily
METEIKIEANNDLQAVQAVRHGDAERYRELVERHERRVFAIAWSRLGDAALAEEAAQEAFIRGYQRLWLLGDGAKFSAWITSITRRVAINFGLRHRRELNKRQRWALEQTPVTPEDSAEAFPPETLRTALAELPAAHRECLVLFYLEGKSGAEAATALGISESALRVRLHRAKAVLRERLEDRLAESLEQLRPSPRVTPNVMAAVLASPKLATAGGTAALGVGAKILASLGSSFLFVWLVPFVSLLTTLPSLLFTSKVGRLERKNFRDAGGFRVEVHRRVWSNFMWVFPLLLVGVHVLVFCTIAFWGLHALLIILACFVSLFIPITARSLILCRNPYQVGMAAYSFIIAVGLICVAVGWLPPMLSALPLAASNVLMLFLLKYRPVRMDYSLFLRAAHGLVKSARGADFTPQEKRFDRPELLRFARFLGTRYLAVNFRWDRDGLILRLQPVAPRLLTNLAFVFLPPIRPNDSFISLGWDGTVIAHCGPADAGALSSLATAQFIHARELEEEVADVIDQAWREFREGNLFAAERTLGQVADSEVFVVPPARSKSTRWWQIGMGVSLVGMVVIIAGQFFLLGHSSPWVLFAPVSVSAPDVRAALAELAEAGPVGSNALLQAQSSWYSFHVLPSPSDDFPPAAWQALRQHLLQFMPATASSSAKVDTLMGYPMLQNAVINGLLNSADFGLTTNEIRAALTPLTDWQRKQWFEPQVLKTVNADRSPAGYTMLDVRALELRTACLQKLDCLNVADGSNAVQTLVQQQMLSSTIPPGRRPVPLPEEWHGLFLTYGYDPITETYDVLKVLERFGGLSRIDANACIQGILRFHHGKGLFRPGKDHDGLVIFGDARDTFCAFESLRILKALDRVKDLDHWQFRPMLTSETDAPRLATWSEIEAWLCAKRLARDLGEHKTNPAAPWRSLLNP